MTSVTEQGFDNKLPIDTLTSLRSRLCDWAMANHHDRPLVSKIEGEPDSIYTRFAEPDTLSDANSFRVDFHRSGEITISTVMVHRDNGDYFNVERVVNSTALVGRAVVNLAGQQRGIALGPTESENQILLQVYQRYMHGTAPDISPKQFAFNLVRKQNAQGIYACSPEMAALIGTLVNPQSNVEPGWLPPRPAEIERETDT